MASRRRIDGSFDEDHNGELRKRKKGGCLTKILIRLGITVGSIAVLIVGALIAGNIVLGNMFGVSLFDLFGVFGDMGANRTEIVANPYTNEDEKGFYDAANDMLYFKSGAEAVLDSEYVHELLGNIPDGNTDSMFDSLLSLLSADNFDKTKLSAYKGWQESVTHLSTLPTITDRQFAAFIKDALLDSGMLDDMLGSALSEIGVANLSDVASIDQVIISKQSAVTRSGADDVMMKLTVSLNVEELVTAIMKHFKLEFLGGVLNFFLPNEAFLSATVNMSDASDGLKLEINALDNQTCNVTAKEEILAKYGDGKGSVTKMERIFVIIESFSGVDVLKTIEDSVKPMLGYFCKGAETETPFCFADLIDLNSVKSNSDGSNSFKLDLFGMLTDLLNSQTGGASQPEDVIVLMQALLCTESEPVYKDDYAHRADLYYDPTGADLAQALASIGKTTLSEITTKAEYDALKKAYGKISYDDFGVTLGTAYVSAYCEEFMDALAKTYCLDLGDYTFYDVLGLLGFSDGNEAVPKFTDLVDGHRLAELAKPENQSDVMKVTDRMLGAIVIELLPELLGSEFEKYDMQLRTVAITERVVERVSHSMLTLKFTVDLSGLIEGDVAEYIGDLVPQAVTFGVTVDMTVGMSKENKLPAEIACFNDVTESGTATVLNGLTTGNILSAIERIIPDVDLDKLLSMVSDSLAEVTTGLNEALPYYAFRPSVANNAGYVELPSVFDIAVEFLGLNEEGVDVSGAELKSAVNYLVNYTYDGDNRAENATYEEFLIDIQQNYYIHNNNKALSSFDDLFNTFSGEFNTSVLRLKNIQTYEYSSGAIQMEGMMYDTRSADELNVRIDEVSLLAIMNERLADFDSITDYAQLIDVKITESGITLQLKINVGNLLDAQYSEIISCDAIYVSLAINMNNVIGAGTPNARYETTATINGEGKGDDNFDTTMTIINKFGDGLFDMDGIVADAGKAAYDGLSQIDTAGINYSLENGAIVFPNFYGFMIDMLGITDVTEDELKAVVQGLHHRDENYYISGTNENNYDSEDFLLNPLATGFDFGDIMINPTVGVHGDVTLSGAFPNFTATMTDAKFARVVNMTRNSGNDHLGTFEQLVGIPAGANKGNATKIYEVFSKYTTLDENEDYVLFTFHINVSELVNMDKIGEGIDVHDILPDKLHFTLVYDHNPVTKEVVYHSYSLNGMSEKESKILINKICKMDEETLEAILAEHSSDAENLIATFEFEVVKVDDSTVYGCSQISMPLANLTESLLSMSI